MRHLSFAYGQTLALPEVVGRSLSSSYMPKEGRAHAQFLDTIAAWHQTWAAIDGTVTLKYVTNLYLSEKVVPALANEWGKGTNFLVSEAHRVRLQYRWSQR